MLFHTSGISFQVVAFITNLITAHGADNITGSFAPITVKVLSSEATALPTDVLLQDSVSVQLDDFGSCFAKGQLFAFDRESYGSYMLGVLPLEANSVEIRSVR